MIMYSDKLLATYVMKYGTRTNQMRSNCGDVELKKEYAELCKNDMNYATILSNLTIHEQTMFVRFFQVFLFRIYNVKRIFVSEHSVDWNSFQLFIKSNEQYEKLFFTCFHYYF